MLIGGEREGYSERDWDTVPPIEELCSDGAGEREYKTFDIVGEGGFGRVYKGKRMIKGKGEKKVAIKKMAHSTERERYQNLKEVEFLKRVNHPNIVRYATSYIGIYPCIHSFRDFLSLQL